MKKWKEEHNGAHYFGSSLCKLFNLYNLVKGFWFNSYLQYTSKFKSQFPTYCYLVCLYFDNVWCSHRKQGGKKAWPHVAGFILGLTLTMTADQNQHISKFRSTLSRNIKSKI